MTLNPRIALACAACIIISGLFGSFKSYQIYKDQVIQSQIVKSHEVAEYAAQNIEQKLMQMEAAVSYLDQSTVETLKRFGARYFAYAYLKNGEWSIKWKVLGEVGKEQILGEVKPLPFSDLSQDQRHWKRAENKQLIYIAPVTLANSHQLKEGFLVFGLEKNFFANLNTKNEDYVVIDDSQLELFGTLPDIITDPKDFFAAEVEGIRNIQAETEEGFFMTTASFLPATQFWILRQETMMPVTFAGSRFFSYFILTSFFGLLLMAFLIFSQPQKQPVRPKAKSRFPDLKAGFANFIEKFKNSLVKPEALTAQVEDADQTIEPAVSKEVSDFADFLDNILVDEISRLEKIGVSIKTQVEEGAAVMCSPQRVTDFIKRLIGNSVLSLEGEEQKEIQIQLVEQAQSYQLIYVDTRSKDFPSGQVGSLMAQTEGSLQGIDGIIAYAGWLFGSDLTVAKKGFCLSIDLPKPQSQKVVETSAPAIPVAELTPLEQTLERIEITDSDTDMGMIDATFPSIDEADESGFAAVSMNDTATEETDETERTSFEDVIDQFRMKEFKFTESESESDAELEEEVEDHFAKSIEEIVEDVTAPSDESVELKQDDKGLFEFNSGNLKIKIRSPKKRDVDVDR